MANESLKRESNLNLLEEQQTTTPVAWIQQVRKYKLGLFVTGIIGIILAGLDLASIAMFIHFQSAVDATDILKAISTAITTLSVSFVIVLLIDVIFTVNINRYIKNKKALILYIPCLSLMVCFSVPQILIVLKLLVPGVQIPEIEQYAWANYINIVVCSVYMITELIRLIRHRDEINVTAEIKKALR